MNSFISYYCQLFVVTLKRQRRSTVMHVLCGVRGSPYIGWPAGWQTDRCTDVRRILLGASYTAIGEFRVIYACPFQIRTTQHKLYDFRPCLSQILFIYYAEAALRDVSGYVVSGHSLVTAAILVWQFGLFWHAHAQMAPSVYLTTLLAIVALYKASFSLSYRRPL